VVYNHFDDTVERLGIVSSLLETGANDVIVVKGDAESIDRRERLIPYSKQYVLNIDLGSQRIDVTWDPDF
jgi:16S rRNA processing protein RimM